MNLKKNTNTSFQNNGIVIKQTRIAARSAQLLPNFFSRAFKSYLLIKNRFLYII